MLIYKIFHQSEWDDLVAQGQTLGAPIDLADGYIHFSTAAQVRETAAKHFAGVQGLVLAAVKTQAVKGDLKWEISRGGAEFPHLYAPLQHKDVVWVKPLPFKDGAHEFPEGVV